LISHYEKYKNEFDFLVEDIKNRKKRKINDQNHDEDDDKDNEITENNEIIKSQEIIDKDKKDIKTEIKSDIIDIGSD
jgi:hypothetical protein